MANNRKNNLKACSLKVKKNKHSVNIKIICEKDNKKNMKKKRPERLLIISPKQFLGVNL